MTCQVQTHPRSDIVQCYDARKQLVPGDLVRLNCSSKWFGVLLQVDDWNTTVLWSTKGSLQDLLIAQLQQSMVDEEDSLIMKDLAAVFESS